ncbi:MAG: signal peptidase I [Chloroflexi bacterium HGW-Chloroflexi-4]|jgi:hypothetical protein|nr:MAG: signal peptidase I [Chloroflexi bacterium HGW-Chloroflexi-4]
MDSDYGALGAGIGILGWLLYMAVIVFYIFCMWKIYVKAGKPGWAAIVPIYNILVQLEIVGRPWWYLLLMFVPVVNIVISIMIIFDLAKVFGKGIGFGFGLLFLSFIFIPILAFGDAQYTAPVVAAQ